MKNIIIFAVIIIRFSGLRVSVGKIIHKMLPLVPRCLNSIGGKHSPGSVKWSGVLFVLQHCSPRCVLPPTPKGRDISDKRIADIEMRLRKIRQRFNPSGLPTCMVGPTSRNLTSEILWMIRWGTEVRGRSGHSKARNSSSPSWSNPQKGIDRLPCRGFALAMSNG